MKGKQITVRALQDEINSGLCELFGFRYEGIDYLGRAHEIINNVFAKYDIKEIRTWQRWIVPNAKEHGVELGVVDKIAVIDVELQKDKRYKYGAGRGKLICISVNFGDKFLDMTLSDVRKRLFEEKRDGYVENLKKIREKASKECEDAANKIAELLVVEF